MKNKNNIFKKIFCLAVTFVFALGFGSALAQVAQTEGIQISPLTFDYEIDPGGEESGAIYVTNRSTTDNLNYVTETEDFKNTSEEGAPSFEGVKAQEGVSMLSDWITVTDNAEGTLAPGESVKIDFTINLPDNAEPGGHYAALFAKQVKDLNTDGATEVGVLSRVGALILVTVPGDVTKTAEITEFNAPTIAWWGPVDMTMKVKNTGTVHYDSTGTVNIDPLLGSNKTLEMGEHTILPDNTRLYEGTWQNKFPFGYYKLTATATDGDGNKITTEKGMFAIPLIIILPILVVIIVVWIIVKVLKSKYNITKDNGSNNQQKPPQPPTNTQPPQTPPTSPPTSGKAM